MAFQTGTALNVDDLMSQLSTFLASNGWTINKTVAGSGDGHSAEYYLQKGSSYFSTRAGVVTGDQWYHGVFSSDVENEFLEIWGNTGFDGGAGPGSQPGSSNPFNGGNIVNFLLPNMTAYYFFTDPAKTYCHAVVETTANEFRHIIFGQVEKLGAYDGGEYVMSCSWSNAANDIDFVSDQAHKVPFVHQGNSSSTRNVLRYNIDGNLWKIAYFEFDFVSWVLPVSGSRNGTYPMDVMMNGTATGTRHAAPNDFNGLTPFMHIPAGWVVRSQTSWLPVGKFSDVRYVNMQNIAPGEVITLGSDNWYCFPIIERKDPGLRDELPNSGYDGYAYKQIP